MIAAAVFLMLSRVLRSLNETSTGYAFVKLMLVFEMLQNLCEICPEL